MKQRACAAFGVDAEVVLLWDYFEACRFMLLEDQLQLSLQQARLGDGQHLLLDPVRQQVSAIVLRGMCETLTGRGGACTHPSRQWSAGHAACMTLRVVSEYSHKLPVRAA